MALGALSLPSVQTSFDAQGTAMVPVTAGGGQTLGKLEIRSPMDTLKDVFFDIRDKLIELVGIERSEANDIPLSDNPDLDNLDTDTKPLAGDRLQSGLGSILGTLKDSFERVSFGEKMTAVLLLGGLALFSKFKDTLVKVLTPVVEFVMDLVDAFGPGAVFAGFIGVFLAFKTGLAQFVLKFAGAQLIKGLNLANLAIRKSGGIMFLAGKTAGKLGNGITSMNNGLKTVVTKIGGAGKMITGGLTKGFTMLGRGLTTLRLGIMSMSSSLGAMLVPFLPAIAIAAAVVAVFYSLKSGFDTFKQSLDDGDSMFTAVLKGLGDAMLTLVTLPYVLVQKLVGFIAGLFGFDNFKEKLESFDIKDQIVKSFKSLMTGMGRIIKAIAKGAGAALAAALPGGKTPQEEFARAYQEVMAGGPGKSETEKADMAAGIQTGDANVAESFYRDQNLIDGNAEGNAKRLANIPGSMRTMFQSGGSDEALVAAGVMSEDEFKVSKAIDTERAKKLKELLEGTFEQMVAKANNVSPIVVNSTKQGDTINQKSETNVTGELTTDHAETTQKMINNAIA
jgi:uncharacterized membrane protein YedE/YeeE